jgi:hypothetical protein
MSSEDDRIDRIIVIQQQIIAIFTGDAPRVDGQGRDRYFLLIQEEARLREEAEKQAGQADGDPDPPGRMIARPKPAAQRQSDWRGVGPFWHTQPHVRGHSCTRSPHCDLVAGDAFFDLAT